MKLKSLLIFLNILCFVKSYKILVVFPVPASSHYILGNSLARALAEAGHEVTIVSPFKDKNPPKNYREVIVTGLIEDKAEQQANFFQAEGESPILFIPQMNKFGAHIVNKTFSNPSFQKLLADNETFDVIIIEQFKNKALNALAWKYQAPLISFSTIGANYWVNSLNGNPSPPSYIPNTFLNFNSDMNFWQRIYNSAVMLFEHLNDYYLDFPGQENLVKTYFPDCPDKAAVMSNVSLILLNSHESTNQAVPIVPNMIRIGGFHIKPPKPLPDDLQKFIDDAKDGVVYFSLGSNLDPAQIQNETKTAIINSLGKLKQKVLWKYSEDDLPGKPPNVKLGKWFPQTDILAHPNIKLFITHGGLLSTLETVYHGIPVLTIPIFGDQKMNAARAEANGIGLNIPFSQLTEETLDDRLNKLLNDPNYSKVIKQRSTFMHDRPMKPIDEAIYWVEFIAKYRGAPHLMVAGYNLTWYQYFLLDVIAFVTLITIFIILLILLTCRKISLSIKKKTKRD